MPQSNTCNFLKTTNYTMDILTHTLSGVAIGTVVSSFSNRGILDKVTIVLISGFAGALPDFDAISLWSGFDSTIGSFFNLPIGGNKKQNINKHTYIPPSFFINIEKD